MTTPSPDRRVATTTRRKLLGLSAAWIATAAVRVSGRAGARPASAPATRKTGAETRLWNSMSSRQQERWAPRGRS